MLYVSQSRSGGVTEEVIVDETPEGEIPEVDIPDPVESTAPTTIEEQVNI